jgi:hypothetical protein
LPLLYTFGRIVLWSSSNSYHQISFTSIFPLGKLGLTTAIMVGLPLLIFKRRARGLQRLLPLGFFVSLLGIAPYVLAAVVGPLKNLPAFLLFNTFGRSDWFSRHLALQPLGASLIFVGFLGVLNLRREKLRYYFLGVLLSVFVILNVGFGFEYVVDYAKQQAVVEKLERSGEDADVNEYIFADRTNLLNARGRVYRPRDWWGLVWSANGLSAAERAEILSSCNGGENGRFVEINGPETHWQALKNWVSDGEMGFEVTVDDTPGACKPELMQLEIASGAIPILFYFTGAKG